MKNRLLNRRQWLRPKSSWGPNSSIHTDVSYHEYKTKTKINRSLDANIGLRDCSNYISFDYDASSERHYALQLRMMDKLIGEMVLVREAFVQGRAQITEQGGWTSVHNS